jgi:hypothetical protein
MSRSLAFIQFAGFSGDSAGHSRRPNRLASGPIPEESSGATASRSPDEAAPASRNVGAATHSAPPPPQASEDGGTSTAVAPPAYSPHPATAGGARRKETL